MHPLQGGQFGQIIITRGHPGHPGDEALALPPGLLRAPWCVHIPLPHDAFLVSVLAPSMGTPAVFLRDSIGSGECHMPCLAQLEFHVQCLRRNPACGTHCCCNVPRLRHILRHLLASCGPRLQNSRGRQNGPPPGSACLVPLRRDSPSRATCESVPLPARDFTILACSRGLRRADTFSESSPEPGAPRICAAGSPARGPPWKSPDQIRAYHPIRRVLPSAPSISPGLLPSQAAHSVDETVITSLEYASHVLCLVSTAPMQRNLLYSLSSIVSCR